jgi:nucleoside-diphosphate-sugar epimerase
MLTPVRVGFLGRNRDFSCAKARSELGYKPRYNVQESLRDAVTWYGKLNKEQMEDIPELRVLVAR